MSSGMKVVAVLAAALALAVPAAATPAQNGLHGRVWEGPTTPVCRSDLPCERPAANLTLTFSRDGVLAKTVKTDAKGWYTATMPAAIYTVKANRGMRRTPVPMRVKVRSGHVDRLDFHIDTGIR